MDEILKSCTETELLQIARQSGIGILRRGIDRDELIQIVSGEIEATRDHYSATNTSRRKLEQFIEKNWKILASQLPGCNGKCTTYPCSDAQHSSCLLPNKDLVVS